MIGSKVAVMVGKRAVAVVGTLCGLCGVSRAFLPAARPTAPRTCGTRTWAISGGGDYDLLGGSKPPAKPKMEYDLLGGSSKPADAGDVPLLEEVRGQHRGATPHTSCAG